MLNKKGGTTLTLYTIFILLAVLIIAGVMLYNAYKINSSDELALKTLVVDLAFEIESLLALPDDVNSFVDFYFPFDVDVVIGSNVVKLSKGHITVSFPYSGSPYIKTQLNKFSGVRHVYLVKNGDLLSFSDKFVSQNNLFTCPDIDLSLSTIVIDPGKGFDEGSQKSDKGKIINNISESLLTLRIASLLQQSADSFSFISTRKVGSRLQDSFVSLGERMALAENADALVSIHVGDQENTVKAYVNPSKESVALACRVLNGFAKMFPSKDDELNFAIIPVNFKLIPEDDYKQVLNIDKPAVLLEIGDGNDGLILKKQLIVKAIMEGLRNV
ncbi:hypothetical protein DRJ25_00085 [Candidatus Woesearchaeota archaeon]|nr:MAG: hypothetical protein DRJ25_00085 [Candidatus Woesearchaeota archaeon]